ncbi:UNVERIFIED_CONTAM: hypothetical protein K2H54_060125 [Gekko kuhli]
MSEYVRMTDTERDQIDQDAQIFMRTCAEAIQQLRTEAHKDIHSPQVKQHREAVLDFIEDYLKRVCKLYSEQRAIRVKRVVDKKRLLSVEETESSSDSDAGSAGKAGVVGRAGMTERSRLEPEQGKKVSATPSPESTAQPASEEQEGRLLCEENKDRNQACFLQAQRHPGAVWGV